MYLTELFLLIPTQSVVAYFPSNLGFDVHSRVHATAGGDVTVVVGLPQGSTLMALLFFSMYNTIVLIDVLIAVTMRKTFLTIHKDV